MKAKFKTGPMLADHFGLITVNEVLERYGIASIENAQKLTDKELLRCRGVGKKLIARLRGLRPDGQIECTDFVFCNHHHAITEDQKLVNFGSGQFVADKVMIPLLKALNEIGLTTRTHCSGHEHKDAFISIILDNAEIEVKEVNERDSSRTQFNGKREILIQWKRP